MVIAPPTRYWFNFQTTRDPQQPPVIRGSPLGWFNRHNFMGLTFNNGSPLGSGGLDSIKCGFSQWINWDFLHYFGVFENGMNGPVWLLFQGESEIITNQFCTRYLYGHFFPWGYNKSTGRKKTIHGAVPAWPWPWLLKITISIGLLSISK